MGAAIVDHGADHHMTAILPPRMETLLVTGGAGFIGCNFVRLALAETRGADRRPRQAHLRRAAWRTWPTSSAIPRLTFVQGDIADRVEVRRRLRRAPARRGRQLRGREPRRPLDRGRQRLHPDQHRGRLRAARSGAPARRGLDETERELPLPPRLDRRGLRQPGADRRVLGDHPLRAQLPLRRLQGRRRPPGARLPRDLRPAGPAHQLLEQLRPVPVPREADPADDRSTPWKASRLPIYGDGGNVRDWIYVEDHCRGVLAVAAAGPARREVQPGRAQRADQPPDRGRPLRDPGERAAGGRNPALRDGDRLLQGPQDLRRGPARPRPALRHRRRQGADRARLGAPARLRLRPARHRALVPREPRLVRGRAGRQVRAASASA